MILLTSSKHKVETAEKYISDISQADDLPTEEIDKNRQRNADLYIANPWTCELLFHYFKTKLNCPNIVIRTGFSIDRGLKKNKLFTEHFKECTFKPQITQKAQEVENKKTSMIKINESLNVFDHDKNMLESPMGSNERSIKNIDEPKSISNKGSKRRKSRAKGDNFGKSYSKLLLQNLTILNSSS